MELKSLRELFAGNHEHQGPDGLVQRPEMQLKIHRIIKVKEDTEKLYEELFSNLDYAGKQLQGDPDNQIWRRMKIHCFGAAVDGVIWGLKQTTLVIAEFWGGKFSAQELALLKEETIHPFHAKRRSSHNFQSDLQRTITLYAHAHGVPCPTDFKQDGFRALVATYQLRNRLMHPTSAEAFCVNDTEKQRCSVAAAWLRAELKRLTEAGNAMLLHGAAPLTRTPAPSARPRLAPW
jgi:hypothetical protein